jgi:PhzF family phenazine biosynthesis protein
MKIEIFQVDAFTDKLFSGNPAAVCPLKDWLPDSTMQKIASENNLSETAFFIPEEDHYHIRWFTPATEVDLCGHATLATAHVIYCHLEQKKANLIQFNSKSGLLFVRKNGELITMNFPVAKLQKVEPPVEIVQAFRMKPIETWKADDYLILLDSQAAIQSASPDFNLLCSLKSRGVIITAKGDSVDFVSRFFAPGVGIDEDPVTGSAHTMLTPFWAQRLGKNEMTAKQLSRRGGTLFCRLLNDRVDISGKAVTYMTGIISVD